MKTTIIIGERKNIKILKMFTDLGSTSSTGMPRSAEMSSTVLLPSEMMPTPLAMALAVMGWSPVTMITFTDNDINNNTIIHSPASLRDDAYALSDGLGCDWVVACH